MREGAGGSVHSMCALRTHRHVVMNVTPVKDVIGKEIDTQVQRANAPKLRLVRHLQVLQRVPVIGSRLACDSCAQRGYRDLRCFVAIDVNVKLQSGFVIRSHNVIELGRRNVPDSVRVAVVIARPFECAL